MKRITLTRSIASKALVTTDIGFGYCSKAAGRCPVQDARPSAFNEIALAVSMDAATLRVSERRHGGIQTPKQLDGQQLPVAHAVVWALTQTRPLRAFQCRRCPQHVGYWSPCPSVPTKHAAAVGADAARMTHSLRTRCCNDSSFLPSSLLVLSRNEAHWW